MKKILVLFLAATGLLALIPTESKAGNIYVVPGYYGNGYYPGYPGYYRGYNYYGDHYRWHRWHRHHHHDDDED
jgi:hypothetical protein